MLPSAWEEYSALDNVEVNYPKLDSFSSLVVKLLGRACEVPLGLVVKFYSRLIYPKVDKKASWHFSDEVKDQISVFSAKKYRYPFWDK